MCGRTGQRVPAWRALRPWPSTLWTDPNSARQHSPHDSHEKLVRSLSVTAVRPSAPQPAQRLGGGWAAPAPTRRHGKRHKPSYRYAIKATRPAGRAQRPVIPGLAAPASPGQRHPARAAGPCVPDRVELLRPAQCDHVGPFGAFVPAEREFRLYGDQSCPVRRGASGSRARAMGRATRAESGAGRPTRSW